MNRTRTIVALALTYAVLGILMNSVGIVILQSARHFDATKPMGSTLEACKDLSVVVASFLLATRIPAIGYRRSLIGVMAVMAIACAAASLADRFVAMQALFVVTGLSFGVAKVATYATIGVLARDPADHASVTGLIEGVFMIGLLAGVWLFGWFVGADQTGRDWLHVYWLLAAACGVLVIVWLATPIDERSVAAPGAPTTDWADMARLALLPMTVAILGGLFLYVLIEQGIGTWLPTFNNQVLHLPPAMSVQMSSIFVGSLAVGRLAAGVALRRIDWLAVLLACLAGVAILILVSLPLGSGLRGGTVSGWGDAPVAAYLFPLLGFFLAPIYPTLCSVALSGLPRHRHAAMMGLIVIFSALGGTLGSFLTGLLFQKIDGAVAFYATLLPVALIAAALPTIRRRQRLMQERAAA